VIGVMDGPGRQPERLALQRGQEWQTWIGHWRTPRGKGRYFTMGLKPCAPKVVLLGEDFWLISALLVVELVDGTNFVSL
jgi:hypothetical protein